MRNQKRRSLEQILTNPPTGPGLDFGDDLDVGGDAQTPHPGSPGAMPYQTTDQDVRTY